MYFVYLYENRTMNPVEIILERGVRDNDGGVNLIKVPCKHIWKCHKPPPMQLIYANKNIRKKREKTQMTLSHTFPGAPGCMLRLYQKSFHR
jgi:hypothetical protein